MSSLQKEYEIILSKFKEEICREPEADFTPYIRELAAKLSVRTKERGRNVISTLLLNLYGQDTDSLAKDITLLKIKFKMAGGPANAAPSQRAELLPYLCEALSPYIREDFPDILKMCEYRMKNGI